MNIYISLYICLNLGIVSSILTLENPVDRGGWWAVLRAAQSPTRLKQLSMHACMHACMYYFVLCRL